MITAGTVIDDRYEVLAVLGVGGFGAVYKAAQKQFDRLVAIKTLNTTLLLERDGLARFEREAKAINALKHVNIVGFYGYGAWEQAPYMVMELVDGKSLEKLISQGPIEPRRALAIISQVFEGLASAHAAGVVHRDLKPSNILLTTEGAGGGDRVKIIDFGLARLMPAYGIPGQKLTETGYTLGSCHYMPPEQALGLGVDQRADIYSAGCVFYQMITGKLPFEGDDNIAVMFQHLNNQAAPLGNFLQPGSLTDALSNFVFNCMAKERDDRYQNCTEALDDLKAIQQGEFRKVQPLVVRPQTARRREAYKVSRGFVIASAAICLSFCICGFWFWRHQPDAPSSTTANSNARELYVEVYRTLRRDGLESDRLTPLVNRMFEIDATEHSLSAAQKLDATYALLLADEAKAFKLHHELNATPERSQRLQQVLAFRKTVSGDTRSCNIYRDSAAIRYASDIGRNDLANEFSEIAKRNPSQYERTNAKIVTAGEFLRRGYFRDAEITAAAASFQAPPGMDMDPYVMDQSCRLAAIQANAQVMQDKSTAALKTCRTLVESENQKRVGYRIEARAYYRLGKFNEALESTNKALEGGGIGSSDGDQTALNYRILCLYKLGRVEESMQVYQKSHRKPQIENAGEYYDGAGAVAQYDQHLMDEYEKKVLGNKS
jgi:tetratricopeptide (TPR) repeat protein/predicted Ser/Thr protein kinase